jgi:hypothetical protein
VGAASSNTVIVEGGQISAGKKERKSIHTVLTSAIDKAYLPGFEHINRESVARPDNERNTMASLDPFSAQIVQLVRNMPDDAILALVRNQLGAVTGAAAVVAPMAKKRGRPKKVVAKVTKVTAKAKTITKKKAAKKVAKKKPVGRPKKRTSAARLKVLASVERAVKTSKGLSASEVARTTNIGQVRVATALRELKIAKRIYQGGDRRFARYAGDARTAEQASLHARSNAGGPKTAKKRGRGKKKK